MTALSQDRALDVAEKVNALLPADYRNALAEEDRRVDREVLGPQGLDRRRILLVGGAGYIGTVLTAHLLARGYAVRCFDLMLYNNQTAVLPFLADQDYEFRHGDLAGPGGIADALDGITDVVLLAGLVGDPITKKYPDAAAAINDRGYENLLHQLAGRGLNKVVFVSTCSNYGLVEGNDLVDEEAELTPLSLYAKSKVAVERRILDLEGSVDYAATVLRFATAFGLSPRMRFDLTVSEFTRALVRGEDLLVYDAETWRPYCHVQDFAEVIRRVLEAPRDRVAFEVFNAGGEVNNYTKQMIVDAVLAQAPGARVTYQDHGADPRNYRVDFAKIRQRLYFTPASTVEDGIRELVAALAQGLFRDIDQPPGFFANHVIDYG